MSASGKLKVTSALRVTADLHTSQNREWNSTLTLVQKSHPEAPTSRPPSCPIDCAPSITVQTPSSLHTFTISRHGSSTPGTDATESITATIFCGLLGFSLAARRGSERMCSRKEATICAWVVGSLRSKCASAGCGAVSEMSCSVLRTLLYDVVAGRANHQHHPHQEIDLIFKYVNVPTSDEDVARLPLKIPEHGGDAVACIGDQNDLVRLCADERGEALADAHEGPLVGQPGELVRVALDEHGERRGRLPHGVREGPVCGCGEMAVSISDNRRIDRLWIRNRPSAVGLPGTKRHTSE